MVLRGSEIPKHLLTTPSPLLNELIDYINHTTTEFIPQFSIQTGITFLGHLYSRQYVGDTGLSTGLYSMIVAQSGIGKNYCKESLTEFDELYVNLLGGATSASGLFTALVRNPCLMVVSDEIGDKFDSKSELNRSFWRLAREAFNTKKLTEDSYAARKNGMIEEKSETYNIKYPCMSILGFSTPKQIASGLTDNDIESGTINRFTIVNAFADEIQDNEFGITSIPSIELKNKILSSGSALINEKGQKSYLKSPRLKLIKFSRGDMKRMSKKRRSLLEHKNSIYTVRLVEKSIRMAIILTVSMGLDVIPTNVLDWCLEYEEYWSYTIKNISNSINSTEYSIAVDKLKEKLQSQSDGVEQWKVNKFFREILGMDTYRRNILLKDLEDDKIIEWFDGPKSLKNGKSKKLLTYIGDKRK